MKANLGKLSVFYCSLPCLALAGCGSAEPDRPNILLISVDDLNDWIEPLMGHPNTLTPNIKRLAERGVVFTNAYCQTPLSGPSRTSLLSGQYPSNTGVYYQIKDKQLRDVPALSGEPFLPEYFARHGYKTMGAGKIFHDGGGDRAFQEYGGTFGMYGPRAEKRFKYDPEWFGKPRGTQTDWAAYPETDEEMPDHRTAAWVAARLGESHEKPFLLAAGLVRPHVPWYVPAQWLDKIPPESVQLPPYNPDDYDDIPEIARRVTGLPMMPDFDWVVENGYWREMVHAYLSCVVFMDHQVGKLLDALDASPYRDNTIIILYGDNGYEMGQKERFAKHALWRTSVRVPLIIAAPGFTAGGSCPANVGLIDIYPTLAALCGLPENPANNGVSLIPLLKNVRKEWNRPAYTFYGPGNQSIVLDDWHYIRYSDGSEELYDLAKDTQEWDNLAARTGHALILERLRALTIADPESNVPQSFNNSNEYFMLQTER